jgi:hypothetical protein
MNRPLIATAFAAVILPALAAGAAAAPYPPYHPYGTRLGCSTGSYSVERGKDFILVRNLGRRAIPKGTKIQLTIFLGGFRVTRKTETMWKTLGTGTDTITFVQPDGATRCQVRVIYG